MRPSQPERAEPRKQDEKMKEIYPSFSEFSKHKSEQKHNKDQDMRHEGVLRLVFT